MDILVVCTANIARSPLAEAMLARHLDAGFRVASAGTRARDGDPAAEGTFALAEERGIDLRAHRSRPVTSDLVANADLVLTMSTRQRDACAPLTSDAGGRVFTFGEFARLLDAVDLGDAPVDPLERAVWLRDQAHRARPRARPPGDDEDVADPMGRRWSHWVAMGERLDALTERIGTAVVPPDA